MNKQVSWKLQNAAEHAGETFSNPNRDHNYSKEQFCLETVTPLSEYTAIALYRKSEGKIALAFFYYLNMGEGVWRYFFPTDSHILGMQLFGEHKLNVEEHNFPLNFEKNIEVTTK